MSNREFTISVSLDPDFWATQLAAQLADTQRIVTIGEHKFLVTGWDETYDDTGTVPLYTVTLDLQQL